MTPTSKHQGLVLTSTQAVAARPEAVFKLLDDYPGYGAWAPFLTISPTAKETDPNRMDFAIRLDQLKKPVVLFGKETAREPHRLVAWSLGARGALTLRESFTIERAMAGSVIIHHVTFEGVLRWVLGPPLLRLYRPVFGALDRALRRRLGGSKARR